MLARATAPGKVPSLRGSARAEACYDPAGAPCLAVSSSSLSMVSTPND